MLLAYEHALRVSEVLSLTRSNFDMTEDCWYLRVQRIKGSKSTVQPLTERTRAAVEVLLSSTKGNARLFPITRCRVNQLLLWMGVRAGIPEHLCHPHALRHSLAHHVVDAAGVPALQKYMGHVSANSTLVYTELNEAQAAQRVQDALGA